MAQDHGGEAGIDKVMEVFGNGIEGDKVVDGKLLSELKYELRVVEKGIEDVEMSTIAVVQLWGLPRALAA